MKILVFLMACASAATCAVKAEKIAYKGWPNCYRVSNGEVELVVTADVGPRVIRYGFVGGQNVFKEFPDQLGKTGEAQFQLRGGHRVWKAPEDPVESWTPDNQPVKIELAADGLTAREPVESAGLQKEISIHLAPTGTSVTVIHRIANRGQSNREFSVWAMSMMAQGGVAIASFPDRGSYPQHLTATNPLVMWAYTDLSDPRWKFTRKYMMLRQDPSNPNAEKIGLFSPIPWAAYVRNNEAFIKVAQADRARTYPDFGCSFETFTNNEFLEIETLSPMGKAAPGESLEHTEHWSLARGIHLSEFTDAELDRVILPLVHNIPSQ
ncbi:MAG: hypothetical protein ABSH49_20060 [Bryobacteraceae bacterium]|jgi:hypothetical protein